MVVKVLILSILAFLFVLVVIPACAGLSVRQAIKSYHKTLEEITKNYSQNKKGGDNGKEDK